MQDKNLFRKYKLYPNKVEQIAVVAGGSKPDEFVSEIKKADLVVGVDKGAYWLVNQVVKIDVAIGDFDSVTKEELQIVERNVKKIIKVTPEKDATDLELAIDYLIKLNPESVVIYGAIGSRFDQSLQSVYLLELLLSHNINAKIVNGTNEIYVTKSKLIFLTPLPFPYCSVVPISEKAVVSLSGFKYPLEREVLYRIHSRGISNEIIRSPAEVMVYNGTVAVILSRD